MQELISLFQKVVWMNQRASVIILVVLGARMILKKLPTGYLYYLWAVVGFRLCCPFSVSSILSIFNWNLLKTSQKDYGTQAALMEETVLLKVAACIWLMGILLLFLHSVYSRMKLRRMTKQAVWLKDNIYECDNIPSPFVAGIFRPKIYIPFRLGREEQKLVLLHEKEHIRRKDHVAKWLAYVLLVIHWFNPLVWVSYDWMEQDMEMSCDENVLDILGEEYRVPYSSLLLSFAANRRQNIVSPIAFGENNTERRVKNVLKHREMRKSIAIIGMLALLLVGAACITDALKVPGSEQAAMEEEMLTLREYNEEYRTQLLEKEQQLQEREQLLLEKEQELQEMREVLNKSGQQ